VDTTKEVEIVLSEVHRRITDLCKKNGVFLSGDYGSGSILYKRVGKMIVEKDIYIGE
jgi:hypothetical protein